MRVKGKKYDHLRRGSSIYTFSSSYIIYKSFKNEGGKGTRQTFGREIQSNSARYINETVNVDLCYS